MCGDFSQFQTHSIMPLDECFLQHPVGQPAVATANGGSQSWADYAPILFRTNSINQITTF